MATLLVVLGLQTSFWSATAAYLTSERQGVLQRPLRPWLGWGGFVLGAVLSMAALSAAHDRITALVYWLSAVMTAWCLLVLITPHSASRARTLGCGAGLMLLAAVLE